MRLHSNRISVSTHKPFEFVDVTQTIIEEVRKSQISDGIVLASVLHTTAAMVIQEGDPTVHDDTHTVLENLISSKASYKHSYEGSTNGAAHQRQQLLGTTVTLTLKDNDLVLGTWQRVFLVELFRPMQRQMQITVLGS